MIAEMEELISTPVATKDYSVIDISVLPVIVLGVKIKNKFDEERINFKSKYNSKRILHFRVLDQLEPVFLYGVMLTPPSKYKPLLDCINSGDIFRDQINTEKQLHAYMELLQQYDMSCNECYKYLSDGLYPVDVKHLNTITTNNLNKEIKTGFKCMVQKSRFPWYTNINNFNIFILSYSMGYSSKVRINTSA